MREDIEKFRLDVLEDFPTKQACLAWIRMIMIHIPSWPVGPEPKANVDESPLAILGYI